MTTDNEPRRRVVAPRNPILDVMGEPIVRDESDREQSLSDFVHYGLLRKALEGKKKALLWTLKDCSDREIKLMGQGRYGQRVVYERPNLEYERVGDVAALLGIARPRSAPPRAQRHPFERDDRFELLQWVVPYARKLGRCSEEHVINIREWEAEGCPQWRDWRGIADNLTHYLDSCTGEYVELLSIGSTPGEAIPQPKRSIHPYDKKIYFPRDGQKLRMTVVEALVLRARHYVATHPKDTEFAIALLTIENRMNAARQKQGKLVDNGHIPLLDEDKLHSALAVASLEAALIGMGAAEIRFPYQKYARAELSPWLVQAALDRVKKRRFTLIEQIRIVTRTRHPEQVIWPEWWELDWYPKRGSKEG